MSSHLVDTGSGGPLREAIRPALVFLMRLDEAEGARRCRTAPWSEATLRLARAYYSAGWERDDWLGMMYNIRKGVEDYDPFVGAIWSTIWAEGQSLEMLEVEPVGYVWTPREDHETGFFYDG